MSTSHCRYLSPLYLTLLISNAVCLGGLLTLLVLRLASGRMSVPLILAAIGSGLMTLALGGLAVIAARERRNYTRLS